MARTNRKSQVSEREARTFVLDSGRMATDGVVNSLGQTVVMLVAISAFGASDSLKSLLVSAPHIGQLFSLFLTAALASRAFRPSLLAGGLGLAGALALLTASFTSRALPFTVAISVAMMLIQLRYPFIAAFHEHNYPAERRGRRFSTGLTLMLIVALCFDLLSGRLLSVDVTQYRLLFRAAAGAVAVGSVALMFVPSRPAPAAHRTNAFRNLAILKSDRLFRRIIIAWFIMGFANLSTVPLRVVYLAEADRGLGLSPWLVMIIGGVIPSITRLVFTRIWAALFDKWHLILIRVVLSTLLGLGIFLYFWTRLIPVLIVGQVILNIAFAGGPILWSLWVARIAPPGKTSVYMSIHTFMNGVRGTIGPALGFLAIAGLSFRTVGAISFALMLVSSAILLPLLKDPRAAAPLASQ